MTEDRTLSTARLFLRPLTTDDADTLFALFGDDEAMHFWHTPVHSNVAETRAMLEDMLTPASCYWALCLQGDDHAVGYLGFLGNPGAPGFGYALRRDLWRQGYMQEAVRPALDYGFDRLRLDRVELWINRDNIASRRLAEKLGFTRRGQFLQKFAHAPTAHETWVYGLFAYEWRATTGDIESAVRPSHQFYRLQPVLPAHDVAETAAFYRDKLGFDIEFLYGDPPTHAGVARGAWTTQGAHIQLTKAEEGVAVRPSGWLYIFVDSEIDLLYADYRENGVKIVQEIASQPWGMREFTVADCNGHRLRFGTPI